MRDELQKKTLAKKIFIYYLSEGSDMFIGVSENIINTIKDKIETGIVVQNLFNSLEIEIIEKLSNTMGNFQDSYEYKDYDSKKKFVKSSFSTL